MPKKRERGPRGQGSVFYRDDKKCWVGRYYDANGMPKFVYGKTQAEALEKKQKAEHAVRSGLPAPNERMKLGPYLLDWLENVVKRELAYNTYIGYRVNVRRHILPHAISRKALINLSPADVRKLCNDLADEGLSAATVKYVRATLRSALSQAVEDTIGGLTRNVALQQRTRRGKRRDKPSKKVEPYTPDKCCNCWTPSEEIGSKHCTRVQWRLGCAVVKHSGYGGKMWTSRTVSKASAYRCSEWRAS